MNPSDPGALASPSARRRIRDLAHEYAKHNGDYREHGPRGWRRRWSGQVPSDWAFPDQLTRGYVLGRIEELRSNPSVEAAEQSFRSIMVWGFGDSNYGPYRVSEMSKSRPAGLGQYLLDVLGATRDDSIDAYNYMVGNSPSWLGPVYATKVAYFVTPGEASPILDSEVALWVAEHQGKRLFSANTWSTDQYARFHAYCQELLEIAGPMVPESHRTLGLVEYLMFVDRAAAGLPAWVKRV